MEGVVSEGDAAELASVLAGLPADRPLRLDLGELELRDGVAVACAIDGLRAALARTGRVHLRQPPQMLAHTLYKIGMLDLGTLSLEDPQAEEPTTAN